MIFNLIVVFTIILSYLFFINNKGVEKNSDNNRKNYIIFVTIILILQSGLRNVAVGSDTYAYYKEFERVKGLRWSEIFSIFDTYYSIGIGKDPGFLVFQKIVQIIIPNYQLFLLLIAFIFFTALAKFVYNNSTRIVDALFAYVLYSSLFYSFFSITGIRQTIATAAALWSYEFIKKRKFIPFLITILIASSIHKSVLIFLPFYFIANIRQTRLVYTLSILLFPVLMILKRKLAFALAFISSSKRYMYYALSTHPAGTYTFTTLILLIVIFGLLFQKKVLNNFPYTDKFYNAMALSVIFLPLTWVDPSLMRVVQYFSIFMLVFIPPIVNSINIEPKALRNVIYSIGIIILIFLIIKNPIEYKFFWQEMKLGNNYR